MKRIVLLALFFAPVAAGIAYFNDPVEFTRYAAMAEVIAIRVWDSVEAHPAPMLVALGTFLLTVVYHKAMGKSLRESVEVAATRVAVVTVPVPEKEAASSENRVVARAKARATRTQLIADQIGLQNRQRKLPEEILKAEKEACYTEQAVADARKAVADAKKALSEKHKAQNAAVAALLALRKEKAEADAELAAIEAELKKLAQLV